MSLLNRVFSLQGKPPPAFLLTHQLCVFCHPGQIHQREQEIAELKQKIAEVMAVMPSLSYSSDGSNLSPVTPHYSSKFMDNSPSSLDPNASVYQPLKKWLWHPHLSDRTWSVSLFWGSRRSSLGYCGSLPALWCTTHRHTEHKTPPYIQYVYLGPCLVLLWELLFWGGCVQ